MLAVLAAVAPGQPLREGLDRIRQSGKGALIVIGDEPEVLDICSGGFLLDARFSPQRLHEVAKMDGAIILAADGSRIARANVHLVPDPSVATVETGTRHRTAERVARSLAVPVISVSESRDAITVYVGDEQRPLLPTALLLARANQGLQTLEQYRNRLGVTTAALSALEVEDLVTQRDVLNVLQRSETVRRIAEEIEAIVVELGSDGRLVQLQLDELIGGIHDDRELVIRDYTAADPEWSAGLAARTLAELSSDDLLDVWLVARAIRLEGVPTDAEAGIQPRGYRLLSRVSRLTDELCEAIVGHFGNLQKILRATPAELASVTGMTEARARGVKENLSRLAESSILDRYT
ncbi:MAG: DNA integrity scanning diadenylate cyclase DisA [Acidimicrobiales bacterium]